MPLLQLPPLSLYIHLPWCVHKCPYCDFNSHALRGNIDEKSYLTALFQDLKNELIHVQGRPIISIFMGGGTPSLFSASAIHELLSFINQHYSLLDDVEITLEANPGTAEQARFRGFREAGVNRLSLGIQSLQNDKLTTLGRIHDANEAHRAIEMARTAGFDNFNLDLMFGLPEQTISDALFDLTEALTHQPPHLSWYQLTLEPNTHFYKQPPVLPNHDLIWQMQEAGHALLQQHELNQYEISAYAKNHHSCHHNLNYWEFGDYIAVGAGAHGKITFRDTQAVKRYSKIKNPKLYLQLEKQIAEETVITQNSLLFEFFLNAFRLFKPVSTILFEQRTGLKAETVKDRIITAKNAGFLTYENDMLSLTQQGRYFLNDVLEIFL